MSNQLQLTLLGTPQFMFRGEPVTGFASNKVRALLIYLAVTGRTHRREALAELLWADTPVSKRVNFNKALSNLRKLGVVLAATSTDTVALDPKHCWVDVIEFEKCITHSQGDLEQCRRAVNFYQEEFLAGFDISLSYEFIGSHTTIPSGRPENAKKA
ncbi:MAG: hypothetical protein R3C14_30400 [Caldilineaceae bacterium]